MKGAAQPTTINLDEQVDNADGFLWCNNFPGSKDLSFSVPVPAAAPVIAPVPAPVPAAIPMPLPASPIIGKAPGLVPNIIGANSVTPIVAGKIEGNFSITCKDHRLEISHLHAECKKADGQWHKTRVDLNVCLTNNNGEIHWKENGNYHSSSRCLLKGHHLHCESKKMDGKEQHNEKNLDEQIKNEDGFLVCMNNPKSREHLFQLERSLY